MEDCSWLSMLMLHTLQYLLSHETLLVTLC